jgi:perosamine synthetase
MRFQTSKPVLAGNESRYVQEALADGWISGHGEFITRFELEVSRFLGIDGGVAVGSGSAALHLALRALGLGAGEEVVVPAFTFVACPNAVTFCGGQPVFADCDPVTRNMTLEHIRAAVTPRTRGVMLVHLFGMPGPVRELRRYCDDNGLWLLEDCAQCFGGRVEGASAGSFGDAAAFSFYGNKVISTGEGGMVFVRDGGKRDLLCCLREQGMDLGRRHWHVERGYNYRMHNLAAAIGCGQIEMADYHIGERRRIAARYRRNLRPLEDCGILQLPVEQPGTLAVYWLYSVVLTRGGTAVRERIRDRAASRFGIQTRPFYYPMHRLPIYLQDLSLPNAEHLSDHGIVLPTYAGLADADIDEISAEIAGCVEEEPCFREMLCATGGSAGGAI